MDLATFFTKIGNVFRWWVTVAPWEQALRVRLGKNVEVLKAGVHLRVPWVDRIYRQSTRRRLSTVPTQTVTTRDGKTLTLSCAVGYAIGDIKALYNTVHQPQDTIETEFQAAVARFVARSTLSECTTEALVKSCLEDVNLERYGLVDVEFHVTDFAVVRAYRLMQGEAKNWTHGDALDTDAMDE